MFRILESQAPAKQTATDTIDVLSSRLQSATLLEDRRAAIQGLRSFAKLYPASVASGGLRSLISSLRNDGEDVDTTKVVLETLLMLFTPDESSPEASDEIALWLADEFTQRQDNITILLDLLETRDFYSRLYSLQLMSHISSARPERTQECIFTAPLGISRLVNVLTDTREPVRNEALVLLIALTPASEELQKLVAFENAFEILFSLIEAEGTLTHGTEVVEDCLSLLAHLLRFNVSNQSFFRETGCVKKVTKLLSDCEQETEGDEQAPPWALIHRDKNVWGLLAIIQLFLVRGGVGTPANQTAFWQNGVTEQVLSIAFGQKFSVSVTSKALSTCADLIRGNSPLQERFGDIEVSWGSRTQDNQATNGHAEPERINVIEAFLKLSLQPSPNNMLDARLAACECMKAFFAHHPGIRMHVLRRAIEGHISGQDRIPNILSVLLTAPESRGNADPYQVWMASVLMFHLIFDDNEAKATAMKVTEGDAESGEEVVTSVQTVIGNLITGLQRGDDERITVGYLMLLCGWLFEDPDVVNDLLVEGSSIQTLLQEIKHQRAPSKLIPGLCTVLLGIIYEFSTKDSPIPRVTLHKLLLEQLGREPYIDKITKLRECPLVRDFEVLPQTAAGQIDGGLPEVFFDRSFVEFLKDNFSRLLRAIDREPGFEISVVANGVEKGVSRELVDSLRAELEDRSQTVQKLESDLVNVQRMLEQEQSDHRKSKESGSLEASKAQQSQQSLRYSHAEELSRVEEQYKQSKNELLKQHGEQLRAIDNQLKQASAEYERKSAKVKSHHDEEVAGFQKTIRGLEGELSKLREQHSNEVSQLKKVIQQLESTISQSKDSHAAQIFEMRQKAQKLESNLSSVKEQHQTESAGLKATIEILESQLATIKSEHDAETADLKKARQMLKSDLDRVQKSTEILEAAKGQQDAEIADLKKTIETLRSDLETAQGTAKDLQETKKKQDSEATDQKKKIKSLEADLDKEKQNTAQALETAKKKQVSEAAELNKVIETLRLDLGNAQQKSDKDIESAKGQQESETGKLKKTIEALRADLEKAQQKSARELETANEGFSSKLSALETRTAEAERKAQEAELQAQKAAQDLKDAKSSLEKAQSEAKEKEGARQATQSELDDLLIVFGDLEAKRAEDKKRLKDLGQEISEDEDEDDEDEEEE
ncbi:uncharacterized protein N7469_008400 [Penicillium citrinum]|uniref:Intracellular protein transport protein n=2 Tax=Penicillium TaxID=5073 RepID=A0A9W9TJ99_PENCI|nr:uncharacterized protein N7469_008400 [Penicillium citrinum]KAJ5224897.1 hypothetical protein N7469_008400 [Penicillium citrinum]KAJ5575154.1 hypothetical protein N7450_009053 [Penicillium hetheringtonii]KAK5796417.1 hypothetical protein VI817_005702 [Penicillium citrinum]